MAGFKLMSKVTEHFDLINKGTRLGLQNTGLTLDPMRYNSMQKVPEQFAKSGKIGYNYNNVNNFDTQNDTNNFASNQLQQVGYTYGR